jgi:hypothetical protein
VRRFGVIVIAAIVMAVAGLGSPAIGSAAEECMHQFGSHQRLVDAGGAIVQEWTVTDLKKSADPAPGYPLAGQLWEATASVQAVSGTVTPVIPNFRVRTADGGTYQVLWQLANPQSIPGSTLAQGQASTGKIYFDATGGDPIAVTYAGSGGRPMMWCDCDAMMSMMPMMSMESMMSMENCPCCN